MAIKYTFFVVILFLSGEFTSTDGSAILYQPYLLSPPVSVLSAADLKSIFDTDKPDAELGARIEQLGNDFKPFIPLGRSLLAKMAVYQLWVDHLAPRLIDAGIRLKDGRSNPAFRTAFSEELRASAEANGIILDELRKLADDSKRLTDMVVQISESLKTKKDKED